MSANVGFALTVVYVVVTIMSPEQLGPEWADCHALAYLAGIIFLLSVHSIISNAHARWSIQASLLLGLFVAIALSGVANGWIGGAVKSWQTFLPSAAVFFFIIANVTTVPRLKFLTLAAVASCLVVVVEALCGYYGSFRSDVFVLQTNLYLHDEVVGQLSRLRGVGFLNDPNDLAQILLIALPLIFIAWQRGRLVFNLLVVLVPASLLLWAIYLTRSRGALVAVGVLALVASRKRISTTASVILAVVLVLGMWALDFTGGRGISPVEGADRIEAWANGLEIFKQAPLFGVGFGGFTDFNEITAHNSFVLCLAELGLVGSTIWVALLVTTLTSLNTIIRQGDGRQTGPISPGVAEREEKSGLLEAVPSFYWPTAISASRMPTAVGVEATADPSCPRLVPMEWILAMRLALISFITTGWFLSRSYATTLYLVLGLATAAIALQRSGDETSSRSRWLFITIAVEALTVMLVYGIVRLRS